MQRHTNRITHAKTKGLPYEPSTIQTRITNTAVLFMKVNAPSSIKVNDPCSMKIKSQPKCALRINSVQTSDF